MEPKDKKWMLLALRAKGMKGHPLYNGPAEPKKGKKRNKRRR